MQDGWNVDKVKLQKCLQVQGNSWIEAHTVVLVRSEEDICDSIRGERSLAAEELHI